MTVTNAMRLLRQAGIDYEVFSYEVDENDLSGVHAAAALGIDPDRMFKTLVTRGESRALYVFCIPVAEELDLRKCAAAAGEKKIEMIHVRELPGLTGYIRGGCSPVGMKKKLPTFIDETAQLWESVFISAGRRGMQLRLDPVSLARYTGAAFADLLR